MMVRETVVVMMMLKSNDGPANALPVAKEKSQKRQMMGTMLYNQKHSQPASQPAFIQGFSCMPSTSTK
jgi:hypothetical protein